MLFFIIIIKKTKLNTVFFGAMPHVGIGNRKVKNMKRWDKSTSRLGRIFHIRTQNMINFQFHRQMIPFLPASFLTLEL